MTRPSNTPNPATITTPGAYEALKPQRRSSATEFLIIAGGLNIMSGFGGRVSSSDAVGPYDLTFYCSYDPASQRYEVEELTATRVADGAPISNAGLQSVSVREAIKQTVGDTVWATDPAWRPSDSRSRPKSDDEYGDAVREYVYARLFGLAPLEHVAKVYGVSQSTATRVIAEARRRGYSTDG
ncbi:DUF1804 family protein [Microbacterium sp. LWO14-1.2]|uniref:hypothetical protein n=1 Tax=Microbacterium sp. LWO14-1.2 TaxID=3135263 RepID=UPI00313871B9